MISCWLINYSCYRPEPCDIIKHINMSSKHWHFNKNSSYKVPVAFSANKISSQWPVLRIDTIIHRWATVFHSYPVPLQAIAYSTISNAFKRHHTEVSISTIFTTTQTAIHQKYYQHGSKSHITPLTEVVLSQGHSREAESQPKKKRGG